jgi:hypothetical protein
MATVIALLLQVALLGVKPVPDPLPMSGAVIGPTHGVALDHGSKVHHEMDAHRSLRASHLVQRESRRMTRIFGSWHPDPGYRIGSTLHRRRRSCRVTCCPLPKVGQFDACGRGSRAGTTRSTKFWKKSTRCSKRSRSWRRARHDRRDAYRLRLLKRKPAGWCGEEPSAGNAGRPSLRGWCLNPRPAGRFQSNSECAEGRSRRFSLTMEALGGLRDQVQRRAAL